MDRTTVERQRPLLRRRRAVPLALAVIAALAAVVAMPGASLASAPPPPAGFSTVWVDDFNGPAGTSPSGSNWRFDTGQGIFGTGEIETMTSSTNNVFLDGQGNLHLRAVRDSSGNWTSGRLETQRSDFEPPPGGVMRVQASIAMPNVNGSNGLGYWPAFWMLGGPYRGVYTNWPSVGEIDILENVNGRPSMFGTFHCGPTIPGPCNETIGIGSGERGCAGCLTAFHTYRVEWDRTVSPQQLRWYLDGSNYFTVSQSQVDPAAWTAATNHGYMIILNVAMGGGLTAGFGGGPTTSTVSGVPMLVDYVRVYQR
jgi:beta-glucanase (GH16 family)